MDKYFHTPEEENEMNKYFHTPEEETQKQMSDYFHAPEEEFQTKKRLVTREKLEQLYMNGLDIINVREVRGNMFVIEYRDNLSQEKESGRGR